jgi:hypothetical protein
MLSFHQMPGLLWRGARSLVLLALLLAGLDAPMVQAQSAVIDIGAATGRPGQAVDVTVSLAASNGAMIAATINDLTFYKRVMSLDPGDCRINPATGKSLSAVVLQETNSARTLRLFVQSIFSPPPVPPGPLYTCTFHIKPTALPGRYPLIIRTAQGFGPTGVEIQRVTGAGGAIVVTIVLVPSPSATPSPTPTPSPSATPTPADPCPPDLTLEPSAGPPGSQVTFSGRCTLLRSGRSGGVYFDGTQVGNVTADTVGNYNGMLTIPSDATLGTHLIRIVSPRQIAVGSFEVSTPSGVCPGDCNGDGTVSIEELLQVVNIAFGDASPSSCPFVDANGDGTTTISELLNAVQSALQGCG